MTKSFFALATTTLIIGLCDCSFIKDPEEHGVIRHLEFNQYSHCEYCVAKRVISRPAGCSAHGICLVSYTDKLSNVHPSIRYLSIDSNLKTTAESSIEDSAVVLSSGLLNEVSSFGDYHGIFALSGDTSVLLFAEGFAVVSTNGIIGSWRVNEFLPKNYFLTYPSIEDKSVAFIPPKLFLLVGGEWHYPLKKYPSDMRYVFEFDLLNQQGRLLNVVNPDFGESYQLLSNTNLSAVHGNLITTYGIDSTIYFYDFKDEHLKQKNIEPIHKSLLNQGYIWSRTTFSDFGELSERYSFRAGSILMEKSGDNEAYSSLYTLFIEFFDKEFNIVGKAFSSQPISNLGDCRILGTDVFWMTKCSSQPHSLDCNCFINASAKDVFDLFKH